VHGPSFVRDFVYGPIKSRYYGLRAFHWLLKKGPALGAAEFVFTERYQILRVSDCGDHVVAVLNTAMGKPRGRYTPQELREALERVRRGEMHVHVAATSPVSLRALFKKEKDMGGDGNVGFQVPWYKACDP
jgi:hypothetical protein